ncbi:hypothetical protein IEQ34_001938 [Dendrobium chrysotoxum]|uniref:Transmembrane protein n=1 Tax=Dendrobium chrysotoxum TaxID=161865 RepID=A0AAV7HI90_DENCH|nr:hypothetical protein IEQ34_001938 [Dendrobium chrysotoxum]
MAQAALSFPCGVGFSLQPKTSCLLSSSFVIPTTNSKSKSRIYAKIDGDGEIKRPEKKFITREEEPDQYWQTAGEREGENPMKTPLPYIIIFGMSTPFVILAIAFANGWIKVPVR